MRNKYFPLVYGQSIVLLIVISNICQEQLINKGSELLFMTLELHVYILLLIVSFIMLKYKRFSIAGNSYVYVIAGLLDFSYSVAANNSFINLNTCFIIYIEQMMYPLAVLADRIFYKTDIRRKRVAIYQVLVTLYLAYSLYKLQGDTKLSYKGFAYVIFANTLEISSNYVQSHILKKNHYLIYLMKTCFWSLIFRLLYINRVIAIEKIVFSPLSIWKEKLWTSLLYIAAYFICYVLSIFYIKKYSCPSFYAHTITTNIYLTCIETIGGHDLKQMLINLCSMTLAIMFVYLEIPKQLQ